MCLYGDTAVDFVTAFCILLVQELWTWGSHSLLCVTKFSWFSSLLELSLIHWLLSIPDSFFLDAESCGKSRAQVATQLLLELNPDVRGDYVDENLGQLLENSPDFFNNFTVVIGTSMTERWIPTYASPIFSSITKTEIRFCCFIIVVINSYF